jgi:hypothetical protein
MSVLRRLRPWCWFLLFFSTLVAAYSVLALAMAGSLSGAPNYAFERAIYNSRVWASTFLLSTSIAVGSIVVLARSRRAR